MMNKVYKLLLFLSAAITFLLIFEYKTAVACKTDNALEGQIIVSTELKNISQADIDGVKKEASKALKSISPILGIDYKKAVQIKIVSKGRVCTTIEDIITLLISHIRNRTAPIIHEVTHVLANHAYNSFFSEGLAVYFEERFGENQAYPNFSVPIDDLMARNKNQFIPITRLINDNEIFGQIGTKKRKLAYLTAGSFFSFLVEKYGEQKLADLNNSKTLDYKKVYGKEINQLEEEWMIHVFEAPLSM